jgi:pilus assembly protein Flp/PilA
MENFRNCMARLVQEEEGAQVVEYALIIAVVSIGLVLALGGSGNSITSKFSAFVDRVGVCLSGTCI